MTELTKGYTALSKDRRPIRAIFFPAEGAAGYIVGDSRDGCHCDAIEAYDEHGEMGWVPWVAVIEDGQIIARLPAWQISVHYTKNGEGR